MAGPNWHLADDRKTVTVSFPSDPPVALKLESRDTRGLLGKLFGKGSVAALLIAVFLISGTAWAATQYHISGSGMKNCGHWLEAKELEVKTILRGVVNWRAFGEWISGYMTAYSRWMEKEPGPVGKLGIPGARAWIDNYCRDNPLRDVSQAAEALIYAIEAK